MYRIALHVENIDLTSLAVLRRLSDAEHLREVAWESVDGHVLAVTHYVGENPVGKIVEVARCITHTFPEVIIGEVDEDFVSIVDIATRLGVTSQAVRNWVDAKRGAGGFPKPSHSVGGGRRASTKIWSWSVVNEWLQVNMKLGDGLKYLSRKQVAQANAELLQADGDFMTHAWKALVQFDLTVSVEPRTEPTRLATEQSPYVCAKSRNFEEGFRSAVTIKMGEPGA